MTLYVTPPNPDAIPGAGGAGAVRRTEQAWWSALGATVAASVDPDDAGVLRLAFPRFRLDPDDDQILLMPVVVEEGS